MKKIWIPQAIVIPMLLWALNPANPYGYYILLRWVYCAAFAYLAIHAWNLEKTVGFGSLGLQPLFTIPFSEFIQHGKYGLLLT